MMHKVPGAHKYYITIESCSRGREHKPNRSTITACDCPGDGNLKVKQGRAVFLTSNCLHWQVASVAVMKNTILKNPQAWGSLFYLLKKAAPYSITYSMHHWNKCPHNNSEVNGGIRSPSDLTSRSEREESPMVACATAAAKVIKEPDTLSHHLLSCYQTTSWKSSGYNSSPIQAQTRQLQQKGYRMSTYGWKALTDDKSGQKW